MSAVLETLRFIPNASCSTFYFSLSLFLQALQDTALIEAFNLKAAIEYQLRNCKTQTHWHYNGYMFTYIFSYTDDGGQEALTDMPPRAEEVRESQSSYSLYSVTRN